MNEPMHFDLVAIGGGFAGLCAAVRGAELGLRTAVLEAGAGEGYLCSSRWAGGIFHVSYHDVKLSPDELLAAINHQTGGEADQELAAAIAADAGRTVDWLTSQGAAFTQGSPIGWHRFTLAPPRAAVAGQDWQGRGPDRLLGELRRRLEERQGRLLLGARAASTAPGAGPGRRRHRTPARRGARYRRRCGGDRRWRVSRQCRAVPQLYRAATRPGADAPRRQRDRRRPEDGRRGGGGADWARPLLRPSVEPRRDGKYRVVALSADRCGRDRGHCGGSARRPDPRRGAGRHFDRQ